MITIFKTASYTGKYQNFSPLREKEWKGDHCLQYRNNIELYCKY